MRFIRDVLGLTPKQAHDNSELQKALRAHEEACAARRERTSEISSDVERLTALLRETVPPDAENERHDQR